MSIHYFYYQYLHVHCTIEFDESVIDVFFFFFFFHFLMKTLKKSREHRPRLCVEGRQCRPVVCVYIFRVASVACHRDIKRDIWVFWLFETPLKRI